MEELNQNGLNKLNQFAYRCKNQETFKIIAKMEAIVRHKIS
jgi:hypothetical protein